MLEEWQKQECYMAQNFACPKNASSPCFSYKEEQNAIIIFTQKCLYLLYEDDVVLFNLSSCDIIQSEVL